jgi:hypothetical protein
MAWGLIIQKIRLFAAFDDCSKKREKGKNTAVE